jgi:hypothetical protein
MLWAWERPERLRGLDPARVGVAWLAATIDLRGDRVEPRRRRQPLDVDDTAQLLPVVRIESSRLQPPTLNETQRAALTDAIEGVLAWARAPRLQLDFEAVRSERAFYRTLVEGLRARHGFTLALSVTALGSWCFDDGWVAELPVDEVVPMMYRLGPDAEALRRRLARDQRFPVPACNAAGYSTDEPLPERNPPGRRYYFHPRSWDVAAIAAALLGQYPEEIWR